MQRKIDVLVIGHNKLWKDGSEMGRKQNRRFHSAAHTRLFELLRYKCLQAGILIVETEESYTSRKSFALNEDLPVKGEESAPKDAEEQERQPAKEDTPPAVAPVKLRQKRRVRRGQGKKRHELTSEGAPPGWEKIHADLNGALNIIRKVFKRFRQHGRLSPKFWLYWLSPKFGLAPMRLAR